MDFLEYNQFDGGIADSYLAAAPNRYHTADNLLVNEVSKLYTRPGIKCFSAIVPTSGLRVSGIYADTVPLENIFTVGGDSLMYMSTPTSWSEVVGPENNQVFPGKGEDTYETVVPWQRQLITTCPPDNLESPPVRVFCDVESPRNYVAVNLGLPPLLTSPTASGTAGVNNYRYAFHYFYTILDSVGTTYEENGPVTIIEANSLSAPDVNAITINNIPVLANGPTTNYDVINIKVKIFRTVTSGVVFYYVNQINNGTTSYVDSLADAVLDDNQPIYTDGEVLDYYPPPSDSCYVTEVNDFFWFATDQAITHSNQGNPGACPPEFSLDTPQKIRGLSNILGFPILFCDRSIYRIDGFFDEFGDGGYALNEISQVAGCISNRGIVATPEGLIWPGLGGFWFTDGSNCGKISENFNLRYKRFKTAFMVGTYDPTRNLVHWTIADSAASSEGGPTVAIITLHLNYGLSKYSVFTTQSSVNNIFPTALFFTSCEDVDEEYRNSLLIGDERGYFLYQNDLTYTDPIININAAPVDFKRRTVIWNLESLGINLGTDALRKYCTYITAQFDNETDIAVQFFTRRDDGGLWSPLSEFRADGALIWEIAEYNWDDPNDDIPHDWDSQPLVDGRRDIARNQLRSVKRQFRITNSKTWVARSDDLGTATVDGLAQTAVLNDTDFFWPSDCEDYELYFEDDNYTQRYTIIERVSATVVRVIDPFDTMPTGPDVKWQLKGYRKNERCNLLTYSVSFGADGATQPASLGSIGRVNA